MLYEVITEEVVRNLKAIPNPTHGHLEIELNNSYHDVALTVRNILGLEVKKQEFHDLDHLEFDFLGSVGLYFVEVDADHHSYNFV